MRGLSTALPTGSWEWWNGTTRSHKKVPPPLFESDRRLFWEYFIVLQYSSNYFTRSLFHILYLFSTTLTFTIYSLPSLFFPLFTALLFIFKQRLTWLVPTLRLLASPRTCKHIWCDGVMVLLSHLDVWSYLIGSTNSSTVLLMVHWYWHAVEHSRV